MDCRDRVPRVERLVCYLSGLGPGAHHFTVLLFPLLEIGKVLAATSDDWELN